MCEPERYLPKGDAVVLREFDDMQYHWFAYDLSVPLFQFLWNNDLSRSITLSQKDWYYGDVLEGYRSQYQLGEEWIKRIHGFVRFRQIEMYVWIYKLVEESNSDAPNSVRNRMAFHRMREGLSWKEPLL